jgi:hypothetical protein
MINALDEQDELEMKNSNQHDRRTNNYNNNNNNNRHNENYDAGNNANGDYSRGSSNRKKLALLFYILNELDSGD